MNRQGYHDIPDLHHLFTFKNITTDIELDPTNEKEWGLVDFINEFWLRKFARGHRIKWYLCMVD